MRVIPIYARAGLTGFEHILAVGLDRLTEEKVAA